MLYTGTYSNPFRTYPIACLQPEFLELGTEEASQGRSLASIQRSIINGCQPQMLSLVNQGVSLDKVYGLVPWVVYLIQPDAFKIKPVIGVFVQGKHGGEPPICLAPLAT